MQDWRKHHLQNARNKPPSPLLKRLAQQLIAAQAQAAKKPDKPT